MDRFVDGLGILVIENNDQVLLRLGDRPSPVPRPVADRLAAEAGTTCSN